MKTHQHVPNLPEADDSKCKPKTETNLVSEASATQLNGWYNIKNVQSGKYLIFNGKWIEARGDSADAALRFLIKSNSGQSVEIGGESEDKWVNYRSMTGAVKKYDEETNWEFIELADGTWRIYSQEAKQYAGLWDDDDVGVYVRGSMDKPSEKNYWEIEIA